MFPQFSLHQLLTLLIYLNLALLSIGKLNQLQKPYLLLNFAFYKSLNRGLSEKKNENTLNEVLIDIQEPSFGGFSALIVFPSAWFSLPLHI